MKRTSIDVSSAQCALLILATLGIVYLMAMVSLPGRVAGLSGATWVLLVAGGLLTVSVVGVAVLKRMRDDPFDMQLLYLNSLATIVVILAMVDASTGEHWQHVMRALSPMLIFNLVALPWIVTRVLYAGEIVIGRRADGAPFTEQERAQQRIAERRRYPRVPVGGNVEFVADPVFVGEQERLVRGHLKDLSPVGVRTFFHRSPSVGSAVEMSMKLADESEPLVMKGKVVWVRPLKEIGVSDSLWRTSYAAGIEFVSSDTSNRFRLTLRYTYSIMGRRLT